MHVSHTRMSVSIEKSERYGHVVVASARPVSLRGAGAGWNFEIVRTSGIILPTPLL